MDALPRYSASAIIATTLRLTGAVPLVLAVVAAVSYFQSSASLTGLFIVAGGVFAALLHFAAAEALCLLRDMALSSQRAAASTMSSLSPDEFESVIASALRETAPNATDPAKLAFEPSSGVSGTSGRRVVCGQCGKKIRIPETSKYKPGDTAKCPSCRERIVV